MKKFLILLLIITSCNHRTEREIDHTHVESLAKDFMRSTVIPKMKDPKPYEVVDAKVIIKTAADVINDYKFIYDHFSMNDYDSAEHKKRLDSIINVSKDPDSVVSVTVNVAYKTRYQRGDVVTDSIKLGYDQVHDKITYWPF